MSAESTEDVLTGLYTRDAFFQAIKPLANLSQRNQYNVGILIMGIDDFGAFKETHGGPAGDEALKLMADTVSSHVRVSDIVGKYGDETFIVYLPQMDSPALLKIAELIRNYIELETLNKRAMTVSIGGCQGRLGKKVDEDVDRLVSAAERNLMKAQGDGKNRTVVSKL